MQKITISEMKVLEILWNSKEALTIYQINELLNENGINWKYNTVATFLKKLEEKEVISSKKIKNFLYFSILVSKNEFKSNEAKHFIKSKFQGSLLGFMSAFVKEDELSEEELTILKELAKKLDN